jgi:hypothetical protein
MRTKLELWQLVDKHFDTYRYARPRRSGKEIFGRK